MYSFCVQAHTHTSRNFICSAAGHVFYSFNTKKKLEFETISEKIKKDLCRKEILKFFFFFFFYFISMRFTQNRFTNNVDIFFSFERFSSLADAQDVMDDETTTTKKIYMTCFTCRIISILSFYLSFSRFSSCLSYS